MFSRYSHLFRLRARFLPDEPIRILDVGDPFGTIAALFPNDHTVSLDVYADEPVNDRGHQPVLGSGFELPFPDGTFDVAACHDVFEHLPDERRFEFVRELLRVSRGPVVIVAPFADPRTALCEKIVNAHFVARLGHSLSALDEHVDFGLPDLDTLVNQLDAEGIDHRVHGDGWLYHWLGFYLVKAAVVAEHSLNDLRRLDIAVNDLLQAEDHQPPHYRRSVILRASGADLDLPARQPVEDPAAVAAEMLVLSQLALDLQHALPLGQNPVSPGSAFWAWIDAHRDADGPIGGLARSFRTAFTAARAPLQEDHAQAEVDSSELGPRVSVILVNLDGAKYLPDCLDSLAAQQYPSELTEVIVVDNGSVDGSLDLLAEEYPWVRVLPQGYNTGFAPAVRTGVEAATGQCVALINNDMRADPSWLSELVRAYAPDEGYVCVAGQILSWDGSELDFGEGAMNFYGMGYQVGFGTPVERTNTEDGRDLLFACGGSMLVNRDVYLSTGGFDPKFFAYFEDVDFGWRLWLLGHKVRMAANAKTFHRLHGTSSRFPVHQRMLLYERNALRTIIKNYDDDHLSQVLGPALLLLIKRAVIRGELKSDAVQLGGDPEPTEEVSRLTLAHLFAVCEVLDDFDDLMRERHRIQLARRRSDDELIDLFGHPLQPVHTDREYVEAQHQLVSHLPIDPAFRRGRASRLLIVSDEEIGEKLRGPAVRTLEIARALVASVPVTIAVPSAQDKEIDGVELAVYESEDDLRRLAFEANIVIVQGYVLRNHPVLAQTPAVLVADMYDPWLFEGLEIWKNLSEEDARSQHLPFAVSVMNELLDTADFFICASERQRDFWLGMLAGRGRVDETAYAQDPRLRDLIDVVPFGLPDRSPRHLEPVLKGVHPAVSEDDPVVLWGGGTWDWLDPVSVIDAFHTVIQRIPNAKLYFLGRQLSGTGVPNMHMADAAYARAEALGMVGTSVIFGDWAPYDQREAFLLEADVAVTAARDLAETRLAFRSRVLDYLWAGLPVVCTKGDVLADQLEQNGAGIAVPAGDRLRLADAMIRLLENETLRSACSASALELARNYGWRQTVEPLRRVVAAPWRWRETYGRRAHAREIAEDAQTLLRADRIRLSELDALVAQQADHLEVRLDEITALRRYAGELEQTIAHQNKRLDLLRKSPLMPMFRGVKRVVRREPSA